MIYNLGSVYSCLARHLQGIFSPNKPAEGASYLEMQHTLSDLKANPSLGWLDSNTVKICKESEVLANGEWIFEMFAVRELAGVEVPWKGLKSPAFVSFSLDHMLFPLDKCFLRVGTPDLTHLLAWSMSTVPVIEEVLSIFKTKKSLSLLKRRQIHIIF